MTTTSAAVIGIELMTPATVEPFEMEEDGPPSDTESDIESENDDNEQQSFLPSAAAVRSPVESVRSTHSSILDWNLLVWIFVALATASLVGYMKHEDVHSEKIPLEKDEALVPQLNQTVVDLRTHLPPLSQLISTKAGDNKNNMIMSDNVEWMLDFSVVGFPKCGTSFLKYWLGKSRSTYLFNGEVTALAAHRPEKLVQMVHQQLQLFQHDNDTMADLTALRIGIKNPSDIDSPYSLHAYRRYFSSTKLIVLLRHPVLWFQSFYNFRYRNYQKGKNQANGINYATFMDQYNNESLEVSNRTQTPRERKRSPTRKYFPPPQHMVGSCWTRAASEEYRNSSYSCLPFANRLCDSSKHSACTHRAQFHHAISRLGLTPLSDDDEWALLEHHNMTIEPTHQKVLFLEVNQFRHDDSPHSTNEDVRQALQEHIGVNDLPPLPKYTPPYQRVEGEIDICQDEYSDLRQLLVSHGKKASQWILQYLLQSDRAVVANRAEFTSLLQKWQVDPCLPEDPST